MKCLLMYSIALFLFFNSGCATNKEAMHLSISSFENKTIAVLPIPGPSSQITTRKEICIPSSDGMHVYTHDNGLSWTFGAPECRTLKDEIVKNLSSGSCFKRVVDFTPRQKDNVNIDLFLEVDLEEAGKIPSDFGQMCKLKGIVKLTEQRRRYVELKMACGKYNV